MDIVKGCAVVSKAGRDKGRFFAVLDVNESFAEIADGNLRKINRPKRKKLRHLGATGTMFAQDVLESDKLLYTAICLRFYDSIPPSKEG